MQHPHGSRLSVAQQPTTTQKKAHSENIIQAATAVAWNERANEGKPGQMNISAVKRNIYYREFQ